MNSPAQEVERELGDWIATDLAQWRREVRDFLLQTRGEIRLVRNSVSSATLNQTSTLPPPLDSPVDSSAPQEGPAPSLPDGSTKDSDSAMWQNLKQRLTEQLNRRSTSVDERGQEETVPGEVE